MTKKITILGCSSSMGVPVAGDFWGECDPNNPKNRRTKASILVSSDNTDILVDTSVDVRQQLNDAKQKKIDAIFYTHDHSDHINGMDDLRAYSYRSGKPIDFYTNQYTADEIIKRFSYVFDGGMDSALYTPFLKPNVIENKGEITIGDIDLHVFEQDHYSCKSLGFRTGDFAYCIDVVKMDDYALDVLKGVKTFVVDGCAYHREKSVLKSHANLEQVFEWIDIIKPEKTYISDLTMHMDYDTLCKELPDNVRPAYDGLIIDVN